MIRRRTNFRRKSEQGVVIILVAVVLLFVVGAMAALAIDFVSFYTARSEAQLAADSGALAGARVLANSGATSNILDTALAGNACTLASSIATQVAMSNKVGGRNLTSTEVDVSFLGSSIGGGTCSTVGRNPKVQVTVHRDDLPTFFARIWGSTQIALRATAIAEAYNASPSNPPGASRPPVAPTCVKPWLLPNIDPALGDSGGGPQNLIFDRTTGAIQNSALLGWVDTQRPAMLGARCSGGNCSPSPNANVWKFYPGDPADFPPPSSGVPSCGFALNPYQESVAGCVQTPISCNSQVQWDASNHPARNFQTVAAVNCLTHATANSGDNDRISQNPAVNPGLPFQFLGGDANPISSSRGQQVMISDSIVTVPVYDSGPSSPPPAPGPTVTIIGFVQLFLSPDGQQAIGPPNRVRTAIVNLVGCGSNATGAAGTPVFGNGASPVAVRLVTSQ